MRMLKIDRRIEIAIWILAFVAIMGVGYLLKDNVDMDAKRRVRIGYVSWAEGIAMTYLAETILTEKLNCEVELTMADPAPIFTSLADGDLDFFLDAWLPVTHRQYMEEYGEKLVDLGYNYEDARIGLVVPAYEKVKTIPQLADSASRFNGQITGIDSGAGIMQATQKAIDEYGLPMTLVSSSGAAMTASLKGAVENQAPIVVTGWKPHWMFARWDLKFLDDPEKVYGEVENLHAIGRPGVARDLPEITAFFRKFSFNDKQIGSLMEAVVHGSGDRRVAARQWMQEHMQLVESWLGPSSESGPQQ